MYAEYESLLTELAYTWISPTPVYDKEQSTARRPFFFAFTQISICNPKLSTIKVAPIGGKGLSIVCEPILVLPTTLINKAPRPETQNWLGDSVNSPLGSGAADGMLYAAVYCLNTSETWAGVRPDACVKGGPFNSSGLLALRLAPFTSGVTLIEELEAGAALVDGGVAEAVRPGKWPRKRQALQ